MKEGLEGGGDSSRGALALIMFAAAKNYKEISLIIFITFDFREINQT